MQRTRLCKPLSSLLPLSSLPGQSHAHVPLQRQHQKWWCLEGEPRGQAYSGCSIYVVLECEVLQEWGWVFFQPPDLARLCKEGGTLPTVELQEAGRGGNGDALLFGSKAVFCLEETLGPQGDSPFPLYYRDLAPLQALYRPIPRLLWKPAVQENRVRQMEFPFRKAPLPGFHYSLTPWSLGLRGALATWEGRGKGAWIFLPQGLT